MSWTDPAGHSVITKTEPHVRWRGCRDELTVFDVRLAELLCAFDWCQSQVNVSPVGRTRSCMTPQNKSLQSLWNTASRPQLNLDVPVMHWHCSPTQRRWSIWCWGENSLVHKLPGTQTQSNLSLLWSQLLRKQQQALSLTSVLSLAHSEQTVVGANHLKPGSDPEPNAQEDIRRNLETANCSTAKLKAQTFTRRTGWRWRCP